MEASIKTLATKEDLTNVRSEIANLTVSVQKEFDIIRKEIGESKAENIKWMFVFWIGQVAATLGILMLFLKK